MKLTTGQKATFLSWLNANAPAQTFSDQQAADLANATASPNYFAWLKTADKAAVDAAITKANFTPSDAVPASGNTTQITNDQLAYQNRAMICQLKQVNAQWLTSGPAAISTIDARLAGVRQNFQDCLTAIPSGLNAQNTNAGWGVPATPGAVRTAMMRTVTNFEKLFVAQAAAGPGNVGADPRGNNTNPDILGTDFNGDEVASPVSAQMVSDVRGGL